MSPLDTAALIAECRDALAEELAAYDIDPPLFHVKQAHDKCIAWLAAQPAQAEPVARMLRWIGPKEMHKNDVARTFDEYPVGYHKDSSYWEEGALLYTAPPQPLTLSEERIIELWGMRSDGPSNSEISSFALDVLAAAQEGKP